MGPRGEQGELASGPFPGVTTRGVDGAHLDEHAHDDHQTNAHQHHGPPVLLEKKKNKILKIIKVLKTISQIL